MSCSIEKDLEIVRGSIEDYKRLSVYHYRDCRLGPYSHIFTMNLTGSVTRTPSAMVVWRSIPLFSIGDNKFATGEQSAACTPINLGNL